jgi:hypothetical protein
MLTTEYNALKDFQDYIGGLNGPADSTELQIEGHTIIDVNWQSGSGTEKNGAFIEEVLAVAYGQLKGLNDKLPCCENSLALTNIEQAILWLAQRKANRQYRSVDGKDEL